MKIITALLLSIVFLSGFYSPVAADDGIEPFVFRNGITWGMSLEDVQKAEKDDGLVTDGSDGITLLHYDSVSAEDVENVQLDYAFLDNSLFFAQYYKEREPFRQDAESIHLNNSLYFSYGFPDSISVDSAKRYINSLMLIYPDKYSEEEYTMEEYAAFLNKQLCVFALDDGMYIYEKLDVLKYILITYIAPDNE